jgi:exodeoxyribonuclease VII large subunit
LKDDKAQLRAVVWKTSARRIRFRPKDGMKVVARGGIRVYPPRGEYQISVELLEPLGKGSLQQAFEDLKKRLEQEGLFDPRRKRPLPLLPRRIGVVTSPTGAVVRDILRVVKRRYANLEVLIYPARVQGNEATGEIVEGVQTLGGMAGLDVLVVARGGGSIEDLWAFNEEAVARALAASPIPTISAVGHETDFTIADFVADVRAPTPSAAAEIVIGAKEEIEARIGGLLTRLTAALRLRLTRTRHRVEAVTSHRVFEAERGRVRTHAQQVDDLQRRSETALKRHLERQRQRLRLVEQRASAFRWERQLADRRERVERGATRLTEFARAALKAQQGRLARLAGKLESLSPVAALSAQITGTLYGADPRPHGG